MMSALVLAVATSAAIASAAPTGLSQPAPTHGQEPAISAAREVRLRRPQRSSAEVVLRAQAVLGLFSDHPADLDRLEQWAAAALDQPHRTLQVHPLPDTMPGLVVMLHPWEDDLMVFDVERLQARPALEYGPAPATVDAGVGEDAARPVMLDALASLSAAGVLLSGYDPQSAELGVWREREGRGPDRHAEWIVEYQYTLNRHVAGLDILDAGLRVGIHRDGVLSSVRLTDVEVETTEEGTMPLTLSEARDAFLAAEQAHAPGATILVERERVGALLGPLDSEATRAPGLVVNYSLRFVDGSGSAAISREKIATVSLASGDVEQVYPVPATATSE